MVAEALLLFHFAGVSEPEVAHSLWYATGLELAQGLAVVRLPAAAPT